MKSKPASASGSLAIDWSVGPAQRIEAIRSGLPAIDAKQILAGFTLPSGDALRALRLPAATFNRKVRHQQSLAPDESERVIGLARLVDQVDRMIAESGNPKGFDPHEWLSHWLREPVPALGGQRPLDLLDTMEGQALVARTLAQMQSGAYA